MPSNGPRRLDDGTPRGPRVVILVDGETIEAFEGENVAAALLASGRRSCRTTALGGEPRGMYCGIGLCFDCVMIVEGRPNVRTCREPVRDGMKIATQHGDGVPRLPPAGRPE